MSKYEVRVTIELLRPDGTLEAKATHLSEIGPYLDPGFLGNIEQVLDELEDRFRDEFHDEED